MKKRPRRLRAIFAAAVGVAAAGSLAAVALLSGGSVSPSGSAVTPPSPHTSTSANADVASPSGSIVATPSPPPSSRPYETTKAVIVNATITDVRVGVIGPPGTCSVGFAMVAQGKVSRGIVDYFGKGSSVKGLMVDFDNSNPNTVESYLKAQKNHSAETVTIIDNEKPGGCGHQSTIKP